MNTLKKLTFLVEEPVLGSPAQQLLDRLLMGYPREGAFRHLAGCVIQVWTPAGTPSAELKLRMKDFGLVYEKDLNASLAQADGVVVVPNLSVKWNVRQWLEPVLARVAVNTPVFVYGVLGRSRAEAQQWLERAAARKIALLTGTAIATTWRLPEMDVPAGTPLQEALIVVQGPFPQAELDALEGLLPLLEKRAGGESGVRQVRFLKGSDLWPPDQQQPGNWSWSLLAAALSRSDSPQGDPVRDGRTQDLVGLGLVPRLAQQPRGWLLDHNDGLRSTILVLDGVVADFNFALQARDGSILSAQLYRPPAPAQDHFSRLAAVIDDFFQTKQPPWSSQRSLLLADLLGSFTDISG